MPIQPITEHRIAELERKVERLEKAAGFMLWQHSRHSLVSDEHQQACRDLAEEAVILKESADRANAKYAAFETCP